MPKMFVAINLLFCSLIIHALTNEQQQFFAESFVDSDACFVLQEIKTGKIIQQFNKERCAQKFDACSTFKLMLAAMAFEEGYFKSVDQSIKWDGAKHSRAEENQNQTPKNFVANSINWVGDQIVEDLGSTKIESYLRKFGFKELNLKNVTKASEISHGILKTSALDQIKFLRRLWLGEIVSTTTLEKIKLVSIVKNTKSMQLFGKTGTGCIDKGCMSKPGRQLGWFVGVIEKDGKHYAFAFNQATKKPITGYAGPKTSEAAIKYFEKFYH